MAFRDHFADDDVLSVLSIPDEEQEDLSVDVYGGLREEAVSAQRLGVMRNCASYVQGSMERVVVDERSWTNEKMFRVSGLFEWNAKEPVEVVQAMRAGRVRARVSAAMGTGKSTFFPIYVAKEMDHRVLYVAPDTATIGATNKYIRDKGMGRFRRNWSDRVRSWVCCMTYDDFCSWMSSSRRPKMLAAFETLIFDESFLKKPSVVAALKAFAVFAGPTVNLLMCSANIREDAAGLESMSKGAGTVKYLSSLVTPEQAMASGKLVGEYLVDRTMIVLANDERVSDMVTYYEMQGVDVRSLDSASDETTISLVGEWLDGDSVTPRVVVVTHRFSLGFNFPVSFVIVWPFISQWVLENGRVLQREVPMPQTLVNQALSRAGRGIVDGAGGMVMGPERADETDMCFFDKLEEFVMLHACNIRPLRTPYWEECYRVFPKGVEPLTAQQLKKVNMPVYVTARYLGKDGLFAKRYSRALMVFAQMDHYLLAGEDELPVGHDRWLQEDVFASSGAAVCKVPVATVGELQVILHAVEAIAEGKLSMTRWRSEVVMSYHDNDDYIGEAVDVPQIQKTRLRRVRSFEKPVALDKVESPVEPGWSFAATVLNRELGGAGTRHATMLLPERFKEAVSCMKGVVEGFIETPVPVDQTPDGQAGVISLPEDPGVVESPGGSTVCTLSAVLCQTLNAGATLSYDLFREFLDAFRMYSNRLVASRLFDCYGKPWTSVCATLLDASVVSRIVADGLAPHTYSMLAQLNARFSMELISTAKSSNVLKKRYFQLFTSTPTPDAMMRAIRKGRFDNIAQSAGYVARVEQLKFWLDSAIVLAEKHSVYLPGHVTSAQRTLPIHTRTPLGHVGSGKILPSIGYESDNPMSPHYVPAKLHSRSGSNSRDVWY